MIFKNKFLTYNTGRQQWAMASSGFLLDWNTRSKKEKEKKNTDKRPKYRPKNKTKKITAACEKI